MTSQDAFRVALNMVLKHTAEVFESVVDIIAEKYGLDREQMMTVVKEHPRFQNMSVEPAILDFTREPQPEPQPLQDFSAMSDALDAIEPAPAPKPKRTIKIKPKAAAAAVAI
jgi:hypothetical protein